MNTSKTIDPNKLLGFRMALKADPSAKSGKDLIRNGRLGDKLGAKDGAKPRPN
jgi:hypothetical protein